MNKYGILGLLLFNVSMYGCQYHGNSETTIDITSLPHDSMYRCEQCACKASYQVDINNNRFYCCSEHTRIKQSTAYTTNIHITLDNQEWGIPVQSKK